nr:hypothetical transcript [Hymenolepis microstoma]
MCNLSGFCQAGDRGLNICQPAHIELFQRASRIQIFCSRATSNKMFLFEDFKASRWMCIDKREYVDAMAELRVLE